MIDLRLLDIWFTLDLGHEEATGLRGRQRQQCSWQASLPECHSVEDSQADETTFHLVSLSGAGL